MASTESVRFTAELSKLKAGLRANLDRVVQGSAFVVWEAITVGNRYGPGTPVDYGFAVNSWWASVNASGDPGSHPSPPPKGVKLNPRGAFDLAVLQILGGSAGDVFTFSNGAAYARRLEFGHSSQAPAGFVRVVAAQFQTIVTNVARSLDAQGSPA